MLSIYEVTYSKTVFLEKQIKNNTSPSPNYRKTPSHTEYLSTKKEVDIYIGRLTNGLVQYFKVIHGNEVGLNFRNGDVSWDEEYHFNIKEMILNESVIDFIKNS